MNIKQYEHSFFNTKELYLEKVIYSSDSSLVVRIQGQDSLKLEIKFDWIYSFNIIDEGDALKILEEREGCCLGLCQLENSSYLTWFHEQNYNIHKDEKVVHYSLFTQNEIIDILATDPPLLTQVI